jgi:hypothetical protein
MNPTNLYWTTGALGSSGAKTADPADMTRLDARFTRTQ